MVPVTLPELINLSQYCYDTANELQRQYPHIQEHIAYLADVYGARITALFEQALEGSDNDLSAEYHTILHGIQMLGKAAARRKEYALVNQEVLN